MNTVGATLHEATARLRSASPTARLDAELLLAHVLGISRTRLVASLPDTLDAADAARFAQLAERRIAGEPVAYLVGEREFYGLMFAVDARVLVPRPETELLVELALRAAARYADGQRLLVADIGTGSGAIAVAVAHHLPEAYVYATDVSADALVVASHNVERHGLEARIELLLGDQMTPLPEPVDLLLTNPPYTVVSEVEHTVRQYEPHLALDGGGEDGFALIGELIRAAPRHVRGTMLVEIGAWQGAHAVREAQTVFPAAEVVLHRDLAGHDRILEIDVT
jgi:release factor glutamine methyltransferase